MIRKIIRPQSEVYTLYIPKEYINTDVEILILPFDLTNKDSKQDVNENIFLKTAGMLADKNIDPLKCQNQIRSEWDDE